MQKLLGGLQIVEQKNWRGLTTPDHLGWLGMQEPQLINSVIENLFELDKGSNNVVALMNKFPVFELDQDGPYRWRVYGATERPLALVKCTSDEAGSTTVTSTDTFGKNNTIFYLWFNEDLFPGEPAVLAGQTPEYYQYRVKGEPAKIGDLYRYAVVLHNPDPAAYAPYNDLIGGQLFSYMYGLVEQTLSSKGTDIMHSSPFMLENTLSGIRKEYEVPGSMINAGKNAPLATMFKTSDGQMKTRWIDKLSYDFRVQCMQDKAKLLMYGKSTKGPDGNYNAYGLSGNVIRAGFGMYEQMEMGNILTYNDFNLDMLFEFIMDFSVGKMTSASTEWLLTCGAWGAVDFSRAALTKFGGLNWFRSDFNMKNINADGSINAREGQVFSYSFPNNVTVKVMVDSSKDVLPNVKRHPRGGLYSSRIFDVLDIGTSATPNIQIVKVKDTPEVFTYIPGMRSPFNPTGKLDSNSPIQVASPVDGYKVLWYCPAIGIKINNPMRVARIIPADYQA